MSRRALIVSLHIAALLLCLAAAGARAEAGTVYCRYMHYGTQHSMCAAPPVAEAKKACEERAEKEHGEKLDCWCTDDPEYVGNYCKEHAPK